MKIRCPLCSKVLEVPEHHPPRPFCSARCKLADLNNWLNGVYFIVGEPADDEQADEAEYN